MVEFVEEMHVIGGDDLEVHFLGELEQGGIHQALRFEAVIVDLDVGVLFAVDFYDFGEGFAGFFFIASAEPFVHGAGNAASEADDALGILAEGVAIDAGLAIVESFEIALGDEFTEILPALVVFGEQGHVGGPFAAHDLAFVLHGPGCEVNFTAENRFYPGFVAILVKFDGPIEIAMIGHGHGGHSEFFGAFGEILGADHAVQKGKFGMQVKVDEGI